MDIKAQIADLKATNVKLEQDYLEAKALADTVETFKADKTALEVTVADKDKALEASQASINDLTGQLESIKQALSDFKAQQKTAEQLAIELVAKQGVAPMKVEVAEEATTPTDVVAHFTELQKSGKNKEAAAYWQKHRAQILKK